MKKSHDLFFMALIVNGWWKMDFVAYSPGLGETIAHKASST